MLKQQVLLETITMERKNADLPDLECQGQMQNDKVTDTTFEKIKYSKETSSKSEDEINKSNLSNTSSEETSICEASIMCPESPKDTIQEVKVSELNPSMLINRRALPKSAATYELEKFRKNALIIFNHENILYNDPRTGTQEDVEALTKTFEKIGFEVKENIHHDLRKKELMGKLQEFVSRDFTDYGCIGVVVLTHGTSNGFLWAQDRSYNESEIIDHLKNNNRTLITKPKLVIIQACRGSDQKPLVPVYPSGTMEPDVDRDQKPYYLTLDADILKVHSCYAGRPAFRHEVYGTWFIQTLCETIAHQASTHDLETIVTEVKRKVATDINQTPVVESTLLRKLYLVKFDHSPSSDQPDVVRPGSWQSLARPYFLDYVNYFYESLARKFRRLQQQ